MKNKLFVILQHSLTRSEAKKEEIITHLLQSIEIGNNYDYSERCFILLKDYWIAPLISRHSNDLIDEMVSIFTNIQETPDLLLGFVKVIVEDATIGREFCKVTEQFVDGLMEKLLEEDCCKSDSKTSSILQTLIVFCYGRYEELLSPHLNVIVFYAFNSKLTQTAASASKLLGLITETGGSLSQLRQQPRIIEKLTKAIITGPEGNIVHYLKVLNELDRIGSNEVFKMASKFYEFLGNAVGSSKSAISRALLVVGLASSYLNKDLGSSIVSRIVEIHASVIDPAVCEYSRLAFSLFLPKLMTIEELQSDTLNLLNACLEGESRRVRDTLLDSLAKILGSIDIRTEFDSGIQGRSFDPSAYNSASKLVKNCQYLIGESIEKILSAAISGAASTQLRLVKIFEFLVESGIVNPQLLIPHMIAYSLGTRVSIYPVLEKSLDKFGSFFAGCFQKAFSIAFQILTGSAKEHNESEFPGDQMLDYVMHTKNKWKEVIIGCLSLAFKTKDIKCSRWLLNYLLRAGQCSLAEQEFLLKQANAHILEMSEIYFEELELGESVDPLIVNKLVYYLQFTSIIKDQTITAEEVGNASKNRPKRQNSIKSSLLVQDVGSLDQMQAFIESKSIPHSNNELNIPTKCKRTYIKKSQRGRKRRAITAAACDDDLDYQEDPDDPVFS